MHKRLSPALLGLALLALAPAAPAESDRNPDRGPSTGAGSGSAKKKRRDLPPIPEGGLPEGTQRLRLTVGETLPLALPGGTQVICDAPAVVKMEFVAGEIALVAVGPGTTTCGARLAGAMKGLWYIAVDAK